MSSSKKLKCKGTLRQVLSEFVDWISCAHSVMLVFSSQLCDLLSYLPCWPSPLLSGSSLFPPPPLPWVNTVSILSSRIQYVRGEGDGVLGLRQINNFCTVPLQVNFFRWRPFALPSMSLIFLRLGWNHAERQIERIEFLENVEGLVSAVVWVSWNRTWAV